MLFREYISVTKPLHSTVESNFDIICMQKAFLFVGGYSVNLSRTVRTWVRLSFGIIYRHPLCLHVSYETTQSVCKPLSAPLKGSPVKKANTWLHHRPPVSPYSLLYSHQWNLLIWAISIWAHTLRLSRSWLPMAHRQRRAQWGQVTRPPRLGRSIHEPRHLRCAAEVWVLNYNSRYNYILSTYSLPSHRWLAGGALPWGQATPVGSEVRLSKIEP